MTPTALPIPRLPEDRLAFVTGAEQGNGHEIGPGLHCPGARVIVTDANQATVDENGFILSRRRQRTGVKVGSRPKGIACG